MPTKIRLARHGRKARPIYHIVVADSRAPRDGKYIQKLGLYNPNTNPATIDLDFEKALDWLQKGAQPTDTCRSLLSGKGVMLKKHLLEGVKKGAFSEEEAEKRFDAWLKEREAKLRSEVEKISKARQSADKEAQEREAKVNEERAAALAKKKTEASEEAVAETSDEAASEAVAETAEEAAVEESVEESPKAEEPKAEETAEVEEPKAEEAPVVEETKEEAPKAEEVKEEEPKAEETKAEEPTAEAAPAEETAEGKQEEKPESKKEE